MSYEMKYLKYKMKYLALKNQVAGFPLPTREQNMAVKDSKDKQPRPNMTNEEKCASMNGRPAECRAAQNPGCVYMDTAKECVYM